MTATDTSRQRIAELNRLIAEKILPRIPEPGNWPTAIKGLILYRRDWDYLSENCFYPPAITAVIQGQSGKTFPVRLASGGSLSRRPFRTGNRA